MHARAASVPGAVTLLLVLLAGCHGPALEGAPPGHPAPVPMPDVSGLAWVEGTTFLVVHDAKTPDEDERPRVGLVTLMPGAAPTWTPLDVDWSEFGPPSHDLESAARIPGTSTFLLAESGNSGSTHRRIFVVDLDARSLRIREVAEWPVPVYDVEGVAVARRGGELVLVFAERAHGEQGTELAWGRLSLDPLALRAIRRASFENPLVGRDTRAISAIEVGRDGRLYVAAAYDSGDDGGPFRSTVWEIGRFAGQADGEIEIELLAEPRLLATLDGLKAEGLAMTGHGGRERLIVGTDDEDFGGTLRWLSW